MHVHRTTTYRKLGLLAVAGLLAFPALGTATPLAPFIDLQEKGLAIAVDGAGLEGLGGGTRDLTVDVGGTVRFALLYWAGRQRPCEESVPGSGDCVNPGTLAPYRDQEILFNGTPITGTLIGHEHQPVSSNGPIQNVGYFADVTSLVAAAGPGNHTFTFADGNLANNLWRLNGTGIIVGYTDAADPATYRVVIHDGLDFAFGPDPTPGDTRVTAPVTLSHGSNLSPRTGQLWILSGDGTTNRPDRIDISNNPSVLNELNGSEGPEWDTQGLTVDIPAGVGSTTVQLFSAPVNQNPDSLLWEVAAIRVQQLDTSKPTCPIISTVPGPPTVVTVRFQDTGSGLAELLVTKSENADTVVPPFSIGTTAPVEVTATKIDQSKRSRVEIRATDLAGNVALCDPIITELVRDENRAVTQTFTDVPDAEHVVTVFNGNPGFKKLEVTVNGQLFKIKNLAPGEETSISVAAAMRPGDNAVTLTAKGKKGATATVMLWDGVSE
jgi:hypothetical protein